MGEVRGGEQLTLRRAATVASWPKILKNSSKGTTKNIYRPKSLGGRTAPNFGHKWQKRGRKTFSKYFFFLGQF